MTTLSEQPDRSVQTPQADVSLQTEEAKATVEEIKSEKDRKSVV